MSDLVVRALLVPTDGPSRLTRIQVTLDDIYAALGCEMIEAIVGAGEWVAYLDEEGKLDGRAHNPGADRLARALGWRGVPGDHLVGPVLFLGDGGEADVPAAVLEAAAAAGLVVVDETAGK